MLQSMTGYGKAIGTFQNKKLTVEIRALNSKQIDMTVRMPSLYREIEADVRKQISKILERGKIDVNIQLEDTAGSKPVSVNKALVEAYYNDLKEVSKEIGHEPQDYMSLIMRMPDVLSPEKEELEDDERQWVFELTKAAALKLMEFRQQEGEALHKDFKEHIDGIGALLKGIHAFEEVRIEGIRARLMKHMEEFKATNYDNNRLEQELIYYMEKFDVSEEKMRLSNHLNYFLETMVKNASGRKLGFIAQEIGREVNTLGSKSNHAEMQKKVVEMKDHLEKIKEQVLNTL